MNVFRAIVAVLLLIAFLVLGGIMVGHADTQNTSEWERLVYVFTGAEAIIFAALGWVFGKEINRQRAESAEEKAEEAQEDANAERTKGATLAGLVVGGEEGGRAALQAQGVAGAPQGPQAPAAAVSYAKEMYEVK